MLQFSLKTIRITQNIPVINITHFQCALQGSSQQPYGIDKTVYYLIFKMR